MLNKLLGNAVVMKPEDAHKEFEDFIAPNETIDMAFKLVRDKIVFTNKRLIFVDKTGITGKRTIYTSYPYRHITEFIVETAGVMDIDTEITIYVNGHAKPIKRKFKKSGNLVLEVQKAITSHLEV